MGKFFNIVSPSLGIDLGTTNTLVYTENQGIVINEPSVVCIDITDGSILAVGKEASDMLGKTPGNIVAMRPIEDGVIGDYEITQVMLNYFIGSAKPGVSLLSSKVIVSIPSQITDVERRAVEDACMQSGARDVVLVEESLASALGMGLDVFEPRGSMVVNIGGGISEISVISVGGIVATKSLFFGGDRINDIIIEYIKNDYKLIIGDYTAEDIKLSIASVDREKARESIKVTGRDELSGLPRSTSIGSEELVERLYYFVDYLVDGIKDVLERTPPELVRDIVEDGIHLSGGTSLLNGLAEELYDNIGIKIVKDDSPMTSTCLGTGKLIGYFDQLKKRRLNYE